MKDLYREWNSCEFNKDITGRILWRFDANLGFKENAVAMLGDCVDPSQIPDFPQGETAHIENGISGSSPPVAGAVAPHPD
jgi:hypothetical protein